ncbi:phosphatase PAP2 family protein [Shewanella surugensis]|uniref:undecaprenyl-diphosphate phosphatase n=1 Tax=Shewanella surugensis TaxID=212020 RepID=A0ABT0L633_9GAMM|nr:phosphatase PAP2 family protein [Shewanella surugensis]MCL1122940.1 phosphatase PAP2 family protein [Shewanella surugensis]
MSCNQQAHADIERSGDIIHLLLPAAAMSATLIYEDNYKGSIQLIESVGVSRLSVEALKYSIDKTRPDGSNDDSFPSGHTADTFATATFIQQRYGWKWAIPAYIGASYVGYSRINSDQHYLEDVLAGAAIGILSAWYFTEPYQGIKITPIATGQYYGVSVNYTF